MTLHKSFHLSFDKHTSSICKSTFYHIRALHYIHSAITEDMAKDVTSSLVSSWLDYANYLLFVITQKNITWLQCVQNTLGRVVVGHVIPHGTHSSAILHHLHWLPVNQCIKFKLATLTHNTLSSTQPAYLHSLLSYHIPARSLCFLNTSLHNLSLLQFRITTHSVWNSLLLGIHACSSSHRFCHLLKTNCVEQAFSSL